MGMRVYYDKSTVSKSQPIGKWKKSRRVFGKDDEDFKLGKKRKIKLADIDDVGKLDAFKKDLKTDIESLDALKSNLDRFARTIELEVRYPKENFDLITWCSVVSMKNVGWNIPLGI